MDTPVTQVSVEYLQAFADAWNRHDADALMSFMTDDCVFDASAGPDVCGTHYAGRDAVRADGTRVEVNGCDVFTFRGGRIAVKNSYRKNRPPVSTPR